MQTLGIIGFICFVTALILVAGARPRRSSLSQYELERRREQGSTSAAEELAREALLDDILSMQRVVVSLLLVLVVITSVSAFGSVFGVVVSLLIALLYGRMSNLDIVQNISRKMFEHIEPSLLTFAERYPVVGIAIRNVTHETSDVSISSREEFEYLVERSGTLLSADERKLIVNGLRFNHRTVEEIMTPRGVIDTIRHDELIGPLTLDDLHKTGHSRFPVIETDIDHVVGVLHIKELLTLAKKESMTASQMMDAKVYYINQDQTLEHALAAFIKTRHQMFIVVNGYRETAGVVCLEDVIEALLGRKIIDEYDVHDDLRVVAERNSKSNNNPPHRSDV